MSGASVSSDIINHPPHYTYGGIESIDAIEAWGLGFHLGNVVKYIVRAEHKGAALEDLRKARWYLDRDIARREREAGVGVYWTVYSERTGWQCHRRGHEKCRYLHFVNLPGMPAEPF